MGTLEVQGFPAILWCLSFLLTLALLQRVKDTLVR